MTAILGISAFYHDSAAALAVDGQIVAAAQEERFSRVKHDERFPARAVAYCLEAARIAADDLDYVAFYDKPIQKFERILETHLAFAPRGYRAFRRSMSKWLQERLDLPRLFDRELGRAAKSRYIFADHHQSHAASAFFPSPFDEAAILTVDGVGEWSTACWGVGRGNKIELTEEIRFPHSLGLLYSAFTYYLGFRVDSGEYKVMGLAPYGERKYVDRILGRLVDVKADGSFRLDMGYFNYCHGLTMTNRRFEQLFDGPRRPPESPIDQRHMDVAASIQAVTEEIMLRLTRHVHERTGMKNLTLAGGVALNAVANGRIVREGPFDNVWIQPAAGDAGGALGVALLAWGQLLDNERTADGCDAQRGSFLGPEYDDREIAACLEKRGATFMELDDEDELCRRTAELLAQQKTVGWFQGRMEFGPRALGARSILADARSVEMQSKLNRQIKFRESFRPFAPAVLAEKANEWFDLPAGTDSPYMLTTAPVRGATNDVRREEHQQTTGFDRLSLPRGPLPAATHVDGSARLQTVDAGRNRLFHRLLSAFHERTGCPVLVNTSFNVRGEPIVCTPDDAYRCFMATELDALAIGRMMLLKEDQNGAGRDKARSQEHLARFPLD